MTYWMIVTSPENYEKTRSLRFTQQGVKSRHRRKAERMAPGDRVCWYLTGIQSFAATATITSPYFEGSEPIWVSEKTGDTYPWRFKIKKDHAVDPDHAVPAESLLAKLTFVKRWPKPHWRLAFQGNVHELEAKDFAVIEAAVAAGGPSAPVGGPRGLASSHGLGGPRGLASSHGLGGPRGAEPPGGA